MTRFAPIIHARTYSQDFPECLLVRPEAFLKSDIKEIRKYILDATDNLDLHDRPRWLVVDDGRRRIAGIACFIRDLAARAGAGEAAQTYFRDKETRLSKAFVGICLPQGTCVLPSDFDLWHLYESHISDLWNILSPTSLTVPYTEGVFAEAIAPERLPKAHIIKNITLYEDGLGNDMAVFQNCLAQSGTCHFCSGLSQVHIETGKYDRVTTTIGIIRRLEQTPPPPPPKVDEKSNENNGPTVIIPPLPRNAKSSQNDDKKDDKKGKTTVIIKPLPEKTKLPTLLAGGALALCAVGAVLISTAKKKDSVISGVVHEQSGLSRVVEASTDAAAPAFIKKRPVSPDIQLSPDVSGNTAVKPTVTNKDFADAGITLREQNKSDTTVNSMDISKDGPVSGIIPPQASAKDISMKSKDISGDVARAVEKNRKETP